MLVASARGLPLSMIPQTETSSGKPRKTFEKRHPLKGKSNEKPANYCQLTGKKTSSTVWGSIWEDNPTQTFEGYEPVHMKACWQTTPHRPHGHETAWDCKTIHTNSGQKRTGISFGVTKASFFLCKKTTRNDLNTKKPQPQLVTLHGKVQNRGGKKQSDGVMVWGSFSSVGLRGLYFLMQDETIRQERYI